MSAWNGICKRTHGVKTPLWWLKNTTKQFWSVSENLSCHGRPCGCGSALHSTLGPLGFRDFGTWRGMSRGMSRGKSRCHNDVTQIMFVHWAVPWFSFTRSYVHNNPWGRCLGRMPLKKNFSSASLHVDFITMVWWCGSTGPRIPQVSTGETRLAWEIQGGLSVTWYWIVEGHCDILLYFWHPEWPPEKVIQLSFSRDVKNTCVAMQFTPQPEKNR